MSNKQNLQENQAAEVIATTGAWVETNKKNIISIACIGNRFDTRQCISLLSLFDFDNSKLEVLEIIAPRLAEREKAYEILEQFTFSSHKEKAADILLKAQHKKRKKN